MIVEFLVTSRKQTQFIDITEQVSRAVTKSGVAKGLCVVFTPHTTAAITINENADPDVTRDMIMALGKIVPESDPDYRHGEGNSAAHIKSSLFGCDQTIMVKDNALLLGVWQGVYFCEFDGPRSRKVYVRVS